VTQPRQVTAVPAAQLLRIAAVALLTLTPLLTIPLPGWAQQGAAVDVGRIEFNEPLQAGEAHTLPTIGVRNPGTDTSVYVLSMQPLETDQATPDGDWFRFSPAQLELAPGQRDQVQVQLTIPPDARPGGYEALLAAELVVGGEGARVGAAAASHLTFAVATVPQGRSWIIVLVVGLLTAALLFLMLRAANRRYTFQKIQRRS
jgi:uncharacterized membrane protein